MVIRAGSLLARRLIINYPKEGQDSLSFAEFAGKIVSLGKEGIANRQFLSILGCIHQHGACRHQAERPKVVGFGPSMHDCPVSLYQGQRQIDRRCSQEHPSKLPRTDER